MSENIFSNFYNKVLSFFQGEKGDGDSKTTATNRLKLVLMQDRSNLDGATMQKMREQLIAVISKYIEIDKDALNLNLESEGDEIALMLNIPVIRARTPEEIDELEKAEEEAKKENIKAAIEAEIAQLSEDSEKPEEEKTSEEEPEENEASEDETQLENAEEQTPSDNENEEKSDEEGLENEAAETEEEQTDSGKENKASKKQK